MGLDILAADGVEEHWDHGNTVAGHRELGVGIGLQLEIRTGSGLVRHLR